LAIKPIAEMQFAVMLTYQTLTGKTLAVNDSATDEAEMKPKVLPVL
jgi:hypothetical protein